MKDLLRLIEPGMYTTIQDEGRVGYLSKGIPKSGFLDELSAAKANYLVGNTGNSTCLEIIGGIIKVEFLDFASIGVAGAEVKLFLNEVPQDCQKAIHVAPGDILSTKAPKNGNILYLAANGGLGGETIFGSQSTFSTAKWGGIQGRILRPSDIIQRHKAPSTPRMREQLENENFRNAIRILRGPESDSINLKSLLDKKWRVSSESNRTGIRLAGNTIKSRRNIEMLSSPVDVGTIQLTPNGQPIVLLNDGACTGGYPRIGSVIQADLPSLVQKRIGEDVQFKEVEIEEAVSLYKEFRNRINQLE